MSQPISVQESLVMVLVLRCQKFKAKIKLLRASLDAIADFDCECSTNLNVWRAKERCQSCIAKDTIKKAADATRGE